MGEDASLDEFLGGDDRDDAEQRETDSDESAVTDETRTGDDGPVAREDPTPATTTYAWTGEGDPCAACGEVVERRWQQDGSLVCPDCKDWGRS